MGKAKLRQKGTPCPSSAKKVTRRRNGEAFCYQKDPLKEPDEAGRITKARQSRDYREKRKQIIEEAERIIAQAKSMESFPLPHLQKPEECLDNLLTLLGITIKSMYENQEQLCITISPVTAKLGLYSSVLVKDAPAVKVENEM